MFCTPQRFVTRSYTLILLLPFLLPYGSYSRTEDLASKEPRGESETDQPLNFYDLARPYRDKLGGQADQFLEDIDPNILEELKGEDGDEATHVYKTKVFKVNPEMLGQTPNGESFNPDKDVHVVVVGKDILSRGPEDAIIEGLNVATNIPPGELRHVERKLSIGDVQVNEGVTTFKPLLRLKRVHLNCEGDFQEIQFEGADRQDTMYDPRKNNRIFSTTIHSCQDQQGRFVVPYSIVSADVTPVEVLSDGKVETRYLIRIRGILFTQIYRPTFGRLGNWFIARSANANMGADEIENRIAQARLNPAVETTIIAQVKSDQKAKAGSEKIAEAQSDQTVGAGSEKIAQAQPDQKGEVRTAE